MAHLIPFDPFEEMRALQKQFFSDDWGGALQASSAMQLPTTDVYTEDDKQLVVEAHLPHFEDEDVDISIDKGALVIRAEKHDKQEEGDKKKKYVVRESSSSFYRRFRLPEHADEDNISAHIDKGVLKVTVPFKELPKPKKIAVKSQSSNK